MSLLGLRSYHLLHSSHLIVTRLDPVGPKAHVYRMIEVDEHDAISIGTSTDVAPVYLDMYDTSFV